ncbi:MAG: sensor histidine kinase [Bacteroidales bacterium]
MKTIKQKILTYFAILLAFFTIVIVIWQYHREKEFKRMSLHSQLEQYALILENVIKDDYENLEKVTTNFPDELRITLLDTSGIVHFDNSVDDVSSMDNHLLREEVQEALHGEYGVALRHSATLDLDFYYYAVKYENYVIRVSLPHSVSLRTLLAPSGMVLIVMASLFIVALVLTTLISKKLGHTITELREFSLQTKNYENFNFPDGEIGDIGRRIADLYSKNVRAKQRLQSEKKKLISHLNYSAQGIAIYDENYENVFFNPKFVQLYMLLTNDKKFQVNKVLDSKIMKGVEQFIKSAKLKKKYSEMLEKNGKHIKMSAFFFNDKSFEIRLDDITEAENNKMLKKEMTQNIAHELKTPVSAIIGYIETLQSIDNISEEHRKQFLGRMEHQAKRLGQLVVDIGLITKTEEAAHLFKKEKLNLNEIFEDLVDSYKERVVVKLKKKLTIKGNRSLVYSIFQNLIDNSIKYSQSEDPEVTINNYLTDDKFAYFSVYDNGTGIDEKHLQRIFERFYRVDEGRVREAGSTGLGLSIVKNAVILHGGIIEAKNRKGGGLEILFTLAIS